MNTPRLLLLVCTLAATGCAGGVDSSLRQKPDALLGGFKRAVCYSGFRHGQHPDRGDGAVNPTDAQILEDLRILRGRGHFRLVRLYDSGDNSESVLRIIREHRLGMKVLLGAWLDAEESNPGCPWHRQPYPDAVLRANRIKNARETDRAILLANRYSDIVVAVAVGNEALVEWNDHKVPVESLIGYVRKVRKAVPQPVTVADNYNWWSHHGKRLARELDFVSVHTYPLWEKKDVNDAMPFTVANLRDVRRALPDSRLVITEAGWATVASEFGKRAGEDQQKRYYRDLFAWAGRHNITTFFFEGFDEEWKGDPKDPLGAEKHWGLYGVDRKPKKVMRFW